MIELNDNNYYYLSLLQLQYSKKNLKMTTKDIFQRFQSRFIKYQNKLHVTIGISLDRHTCIIGYVCNIFTHKYRKVVFC